MKHAAIRPKLSQFHLSQIHFVCLVLFIPLIAIPIGCSQKHVELAQVATAAERMVIMKIAAPMLPMDDAESAPPFNTEEYDLIRENVFKATVSIPVSTFSIDVDTAAYSNLRRFIQAYQSDQVFVFNGALVDAITVEN